MRDMGSVDVDQLLFEHLQRNGRVTMWCTPGEIAGGDKRLAREIGRRMGKHIKETRQRKVVIGERRYEYRHGQRIVCYRIADLTCVVRKPGSVLQ